MYVVAEEDDGADGNGPIVILCDNWLTPKKTESLWPTSKNPSIFNKHLKNRDDPKEDWTIIKIKRKFCETDDLLDARKKAKEAEVSNDMTDSESGYKRKKYKKSIESSSSGDDIFKNYKSKEKDIFENPEPCEQNTSFIEEGHCSSLLASSQPPSPARLPAENSGFLSQIHENETDIASSPSPEAARHTSTFSAEKTAYEYNVIQMLTTIKEQNTVILEWIRKQNAKEFQILKTDMQWPVLFPLNDQHQVQQLELFLQSTQNFTDLCEYFGEFAGPTVTVTVNGILKHTLTNHLAATYSFRGKKGKLAFEDLTLKTAIVCAVKKLCNVARDQPIEDKMKVWLKHAPQRVILSTRKKNRTSASMTRPSRVPNKVHIYKPT